MRDDDLHFLDVNPGTGRDVRRIAYRRIEAEASGTQRPGVVWLGGFKSDMDSTKAVALDAWARGAGRAFLRFDYFGHGRSSGDFGDGTIGLWLDDALTVARQLTAGPQILVGSSMGGWIALLLARALARTQETERLAGMVLIAPAVDFTEALMWAQFTPEIRTAIETEGRWMRPTDYAAEPYPVTRALIEDGRQHLLLDSEIRAYCPVHILQGMRDPDVPWQHAMLLVEHLAADPVSVTLIKDGDHRQSRPEDLERLVQAVAAMAM
ncbi:alpha/beta hydrolase [Lichenifustis flavocetrariae]|uniref:Palmitoyl-protein thioesterase ABHD10, mitochondrial n=1 Tax=Lichenifustis flavocetrariae TaxID=2949735 RepID=A0AA41YY05_9HYPH|nr:alpha/beta hydrolase [Lichenifustis flavocetrariae]MCW6510656.1 alpha/beta hydrolase [Lichenifustis flavocetrariae]